MLTRLIADYPPDPGRYDELFAGPDAPRAHWLRMFEELADASPASWFPRLDEWTMHGCGGKRIGWNRSPSAARQCSAPPRARMVLLSFRRRVKDFPQTPRLTCFCIEGNWTGWEAYSVGAGGVERTGQETPPTV